MPDDDSAFGEDLNTQFVSVKLPQPAQIEILPQEIVKALQSFGEPLRWAITTVDCETRTLHIEAVVLRSGSSQCSSIEARD